MRLPRPLIGDPQFHLFMAQVYAEMGCPNFAALHATQANKLAKMRAKVYLLELQIMKKQLEDVLSMFSPT